jgi:small basic protein
MHTLKILIAGFVLLGLCVLVGRWLGGASNTAVSTAIKSFIVLWLIATLGNLWFGVSRAGYSLKDEAPVALLVFAVPAIVAALVWWKSS